MPKAPPLQPLQALDQFTISGFNEGSFLAAQMQFAYSLTIKGTGIVHLSDEYLECDHTDYQVFSTCTPHAIPKLQLNREIYYYSFIQEKPLWLQRKPAWFYSKAEQGHIENR